MLRRESPSLRADNAVPCTFLNIQYWNKAIAVFGVYQVHKRNSTSLVTTVSEPRQNMLLAFAITVWIFMSSDMIGLVDLWDGIEAINRKENI
jgi:hypothetical protein